jgi:hypothetical protein
MLDRPIAFGIDLNEDILDKLNPQSPVVIERIASYGMPVGESIFETCIWSGRFIQRVADKGGSWSRITRQEVKLHICRSSKAKDANVTRALLDRFGPKGTKKKQGVLYGMSKHMWAALALAVTHCDLTYKARK